MSFPSAPLRLKAGDKPEDALLYAMKHDTPLGFAAITAVAGAAQTPTGHCPCCTVKEALPEEHRRDVLRHERRGRSGLLVAFAPDSQVGRQIARLLGTDAARPLMRLHTKAYLGFANCCSVLASPVESDVRFSAEEQIGWQSSIDC